MELEPNRAFRCTEDEYCYEIGEFEAPKILIVGCGGAGCNAVNRLKEMGLVRVHTVALDDDEQHLSKIKADERIVLGSSYAQRCENTSPNSAENADFDPQRALEMAISGTDLIFVIAGLGGDVGSKAAPIIAQKAKEEGTLVVCMVSLPFREDILKRALAIETAGALGEVANSLIVLENDRIMEIAPQLNRMQVYLVMDQVLAEMVKGITGIITEPSLINLDYADMNVVMKNGGLSSVLIGEGSVLDDAETIVSSAFMTPLLEADYRKAAGCLLHITGGSDLTLNKATSISKMLTQKMDHQTNLIWGARVKKEFEGKVSIMAIMTGVTSPQLIR